ncbi:MAG: hypothetical protein MRK01_04915 [Candidatus Scalindua sp.]|nr:hypothetical protein [Candidatus Scalindua sp.]
MFGKKNITIFVLLILLFSIGCTSIPVKKYELLTKSSQSIMNGTTETYNRIEKLQHIFSIETADDGQIDANTFQPKIEIEEWKFESFDLTPELRFRETALEVLVKYSLVLEAFTKEDFQGEVNKASIELAGSLKSLAETTAPNDASKTQAVSVLATLVNVIGTQIVVHKQKEALKNVMDLAQNDLNVLATLINGSNGKLKQAVGIHLDRIIRHRNTRRPPVNSIERYNFDLAVSNLISEGIEVKDALDTLSNAVKEYSLAHQEIRQKLDVSGTSIEALTALISEAQRINKFYRSVK